MNILAVDPATLCGWAYGKLEDIQVGTWDLSIRKDESSGMRLIRLKSKLNQIKEAGIDLLVYEAARTSRFPAVLRVQAQIEGVMVEWAESHKIQYRGYSAKEIKKYATGKGNAKKEDMIFAASHKFGRQVEDDNEADALALWHLAWSEYSD